MGSTSLSLRILADILLELYKELPADWARALTSQKENLHQISSVLSERSFIPDSHQIFASLKMPIDSVKVVIVGQDPYPNPNHAMGLAFSVPSTTLKLPPTLKNIFRELNDDLAIRNSSGDLTSWRDQGVLLLNRCLTTDPGLSLQHQSIGWLGFTEAVIAILQEQKVVAVLWGAKAQEMTGYFDEESIISSPHPSPLSAYRGFFGSKPFSRVNSLLESRGLTSINWRTDELQ